MPQHAPFRIPARPREAPPAASPVPCLGRLAVSPKPGVVLVTVGDGPPRPARFTASVRPSALAHPGNVGRDVLLVFEDGDPERPIILDFMGPMPVSDEAPVPEAPVPEAPVSVELPADEHPPEVRVDGRKVLITGEDRIELTCGSGSITLRNDGKIIIKGREIVTRASGTNRVKGGSVQIN